MTVLFEPASAIAASLCLTARAVADKAITDRHPRPCGWCLYSPDELRQMVDGFNAWAGFRERTRTYERHDARIFAELPRAEQARLVLLAQAFEPMQPDPPPPAVAVPLRGKEVPSWLPQD